uniref:Uncharacterized protein n=1 Tax=Sphaerodactylus townsendi TaxID=933632 RepID=A0ACB8EQT9_9SAUR
MKPPVANNNSPLLALPPSASSKALTLPTKAVFHALGGTEGEREQDAARSDTNNPSSRRYDPRKVSLRKEAGGSSRSRSNSSKVCLAREEASKAGEHVDARGVDSGFPLAAMGRRRGLCLQPYVLWLGWMTLWAQGAAGQPKQQQVRPAGAAGAEGGGGGGGGRSSYPALENVERGGIAPAAVASRVRRRGQQDVLRG